MSQWKQMIILYFLSQSQRVVAIILRNKVSRLLLMIGIAFSLISIINKFAQHAFSEYSDICTSSTVKTWKEIVVPGQIRTIRTKVNKTRQSKLQTKIILLWTTYFSEEFSRDFYFFQKGRENFERYNCDVRDCYITSNKTLLPHVDAVLFHARDIYFSKMPPSHRRHQIWILYSMEPPKYVLLKWNLARTIFNWTMTYRSDSDIQVKYGEIHHKHSSCFRKALPRQINASQRRKGAIWMVSNCRTESKREAYVKELRKYYDVDVYGKCSRHRKCEPPQSKKCYDILKSYKFYLSFENSICKDYVTEKFYNILHYDIIPVVLGGANYEKVAPPHSFVDATLFPRPKDLAAHLEAIAKNSSWYNSFFNWKEHYSVHLHPWMCDLCERLHKVQRKIQLLPKNLWSWWVPGASCRRWTKEKGFQNFF